MIALNRSASGCWILLKFATVCAAVVFWALIIMAVLAIVGCGTTPRERYNLAATGFDAASVGVAFYNAAKPLPAPVWAKIQIDESLAVQRMGEANAWLVANPTMADMPGAPFPPLDPLNIAVDIVLKDWHGLSGITLIPTSPTPPATQPGG